MGTVRGLKMTTDSLNTSLPRNGSIYAPIGIFGVRTAALSKRGSLPRTISYL